MVQLDENQQQRLPRLQLQDTDLEAYFRMWDTVLIDMSLDGSILASDF
jgi:hypothetical protein